MKNCKATLILSFLSIVVSGNAGSIFITGHDSIWHSNFGANTTGAKNLSTTAIEYARDGSTLPFLFIESISAVVPSGNAREEPFLTSALGYSSADYDVMEAADLLALSDFRTTLDSYSAIVVASDHGGMLTAAELGFLNTHSSDIIDYLNSGGGLAAFSESNAKGLIGSEQRFGYLPFLVSSTDFGSFESGNTVTAFGADLGLISSDVNGNFSHNYFTETGGMIPVDLFNGDPNKPLSLAFRGSVNESGTVPDSGSTLFLLGFMSSIFYIAGRSNRVELSTHMDL